MSITTYASQDYITNYIDNSVIIDITDKIIDNFFDFSTVDSGLYWVRPESGQWIAANGRGAYQGLFSSIKMTDTIANVWAVNGGCIMLFNNGSISNVRVSLTDALSTAHLNTTDKTVIGAINELHAAIDIDALANSLIESNAFISTPTSAEVGQTIVVKAIDENGKPTEWETSNISESDELLLEYTSEEELTEIQVPLTGLSSKINNAAQLKLYVYVTLPSTDEGTTLGTLNAYFYRTWRLCQFFKDIQKSPSNSQNWVHFTSNLAVMTKSKDNLVSCIASGSVKNGSDWAAITPTASFVNVIDTDNLILTSTLPMGVGTKIKLYARGTL